MDIQKYKSTIIDLINNRHFGYQDVYEYLDGIEPGIFTYFYVYKFIRKTLNIHITYRSITYKDRIGASKEKLHITKETLYDAYVISGHSMQKIATEYGVTAATVLSKLRKYNIQTKKKNGKFNIKPPSIDKDVLFDLYYNQKMSLLDISKKFGFPNQTHVQRDMKIYGLSRRTYKQAGKNLYNTKPELKERTLVCLKRCQTPGFISSLEQTFIGWLESNNILYEHQYRIMPDSHRFDFRISGTNLLVEIDGDYWHSSPSDIIRDKEFDRFAQEYGFNVVHFLGSMILSNNQLFKEILIDKYKLGQFDQ